MREEMKQAHPEMCLLTVGKSDTKTKGSGRSGLTSPPFVERHRKLSRAMSGHFREPMIGINLVDV